MFNSFKKDKGFSLVEMLIVVSIMGILSAVISVSLYKARPKARLGSAQAQMSSLYPSLIICENDGQIINFTGTPPEVGELICETANEAAIFQELPSSWDYVTSSELGTFKAKTTEGDLWEIECGDTGCVTITPTPAP